MSHQWYCFNIAATNKKLLSTGGIWRASSVHFGNHRSEHIILQVGTTEPEMKFKQRNEKDAVLIPLLYDHTPQRSLTLFFSGIWNV